MIHKLTHFDAMVPVVDAADAWCEAKTADEHITALRALYRATKARKADKEV